MARILYFCCVFLILKIEEIRSNEVVPSVAFSVLSDRLDSLALDIYEFQQHTEQNMNAVNYQINDLASELFKISESMEAIFDGVSDTVESEDENEGIRQYIKSLVQKELFAEKMILRQFVDRYERELESLGRYFSDNFDAQNETEVSNSIPLSSDRDKSCNMCMLVATTTEMRTRRLEEQLESLKNESLSRDQQFQELREDIGDTMERVQLIEDAGLQQTENLEDVVDNVDELMKFVEEQNDKAERKVGFTARLTKGSKTYPGNQIIPFDEVKYNYGNGYDPSTGIFTAPKSGTYLFNFNVQSTYSMDAHVCLIVDGTLRLTAVAGKGHRITGGNTGIAYMEEGMMAWVRTTSLRSLYGIWPHRTTFSGVILD
ncbi:hypothetical protein ACF0H5_004149 [Mactra antiquata]